MRLLNYTLQLLFDNINIRFCFYLLISCLYISQTWHEYQDWIFLKRNLSLLINNLNSLVVFLPIKTCKVYSNINTLPCSTDYEVIIIFIMEL